MQRRARPDQHDDDARELKAGDHGRIKTEHLARERHLGDPGGGGRKDHRRHRIAHEPCDARPDQPHGARREQDHEERGPKQAEQPGEKRRTKLGAERAADHDLRGNEQNIRHAPGEQAEIAEQRGDEKGRHEPGVRRARAREKRCDEAGDGERREERQPWSGRHCGERVAGAAAGKPEHQEGRKHHDERNPGGLRHHDRLEMPAIARRKVHGLDHAARDSRKERGGAVDAGEAHIEEAADRADDGGHERGYHDQRQKRHQLCNHGCGELQPGGRSHHHRARRPSPGNEPHRGAGKRHRHGRGQRAKEPRQWQMQGARGKAAGDAGNKRACHGKRGDDVLRPGSDTGEGWHGARPW